MAERSSSGGVPRECGGAPRHSCGRGRVNAERFQARRVSWGGLLPMLRLFARTSSGYSRAAGAVELF